MGMERCRFNIALKTRVVKTWCKCTCTTSGDGNVVRHRRIRQVTRLAAASPEGRAAGNKSVHSLDGSQVQDQAAPLFLWPISSPPQPQENPPLPLPWLSTPSQTHLASLPGVRASCCAMGR